MEFYLAGHVVLRTTRPQSKDRVTIDADELYYDTRRSVAIALKTRLEMRAAPPAPGQPGALRVNVTEPIIVNADKLFQTGENTYEVYDTEIFSSKLPSDPGLKLTLLHATLEERRVPRYNILGQEVVDSKTGQPLMASQSILKGENAVGLVENVPFFWLPYLVTDARQPFGPLENVRIGGNNIFGLDTGVTLNIYKMLGVQPPDGTRWKLYPDYMSKRGPSLGTLFTADGKLADVTGEERQFFPDKVMPGDYTANVRLFGMYDKGHDNLGPRPADMLTFSPPGFRDRATAQAFVWDYPGGFSLAAGLGIFSDRNYLEQYFKREFDSDPNQATFALLKQQDDYWAWSVMAQARPNPWVTTTAWLPRADGYLQGVSLFDMLVSNTRASLGYARLMPSNDPVNPIYSTPPGTPPPPFYQTLQPDNTGRGVVMQELYLPLNAGPFKFVPYTKLMAAGYTADLAGDDSGRLWGGLGAMASVPLTRLYEGVQSDLFNLNGLNHKMTFAANYFYARASDSHTKYGQLDLLNDDSTNQMLREMTPLQPFYNPTAGFALAQSTLFDPQSYAIRRLIDNRYDTLDDINVLQLELRQRLQTQRGYPGSQHIVDWMTLDLSASYFPQPSRDNFGKSFSFMEYRYLWNIGDRTAIESTGHYDPQINGPRIATIGLYLDRPDRTSFYIGYRQIDPLQSRLVTAAVTYIFSQKYAMTLSASYDLGLSQAISNTLVFTRAGRDLSISAGFTYNSLQNNFGLVFEIVPNLLGPGRGFGGSSVFGNGLSMLGR
jgi:hypothetical protein